ncbi:hypothetical protein B0H16DRAFT_1749472 [Mycena metata]|uniref:Uncharacterized protein n=1 Tax=Mycena metata TaxID=1033252 RepID=A0AAD7DT71_9AGAR|nr:hypothetical protein B0H16DRAFT_1749472 [Mycena metata]
MPAFVLTPRRQELLADWAPAFRLLADQHQPMQNFWTCMFANYWGTFSWRRAIDEDSPLGCDPEETTELTLEETHERARTMAKTNCRIKVFFYYQYHKANVEV